MCALYYSTQTEHTLIIDCPSFLLFIAASISSRLHQLALVLDVAAIDEQHHHHHHHHDAPNAPLCLCVCVWDSVCLMRDVVLLFAFQSPSLAPFLAPD